MRSTSRLRPVLFIIPLAAVAALSACLPPAEPTPAATYEGKEIGMLDMHTFAWNARPLVIFADAPDHPLRIKQRQVLEPWQAGLAERDMVVIEVVGDAVTLDGEPCAADVAALKTRYGVAADAGFVVLLIGKDTGVKLRQTRPVTAEELFGLIDSMPMRRREMRDASG